MLHDKVLQLLKEQKAPLSGAYISRCFGVSRAAIWKAIEHLRQAGYIISSAPNRGYQLEFSPDLLSLGELAGALEGRTIGSHLLCLDTVDSTNSEAKRQALAGAPEGLAIFANQQTGGRGRRGRSFLSPAGKGLYCSVLLRPNASLSELSWLTAWTAVAVCNAVERVCGIRPDIKWTNDLLLEDRKVCGILTELGLEGETAQLQYVVVGIGINLSQDEADFGPELAPLAISLQQAAGRVPRRAVLAGALLAALDEMYAGFPTQKETYLARYRAACRTTGREVRLIRASGAETVWAESIDSNFALVVRHPDGRREAVTAGEVSVRSAPCAKESAESS